MKSDPLLACPEIDPFQADWVTLDSTDPATAEKSGDAARACRDRIVAEGWNPADYNTSENSADIADLRVTLESNEWNLYLRLLRHRSRPADPSRPPEGDPVDRP